MFDYDRQGRFIAMADGAEILVQDGPSEGPLWRMVGDHPLVGVAIHQDAIWTVDEAGHLIGRDASTGAQKAALEVGDGCRALAASDQGLLAIARAEEVVVIQGGAILRRLPVDDPTALAWSPTGMLGVGTAAGDIKAFKDDTTPSSEATLPAGVTALTWGGGSEGWLAGAGPTLFRLNAEGIARVTGGPGDILSISASPSGHRVALQIGERIVLVLVMPSRDTLTTVQYMDRTVTGVRIGPGNWLGIGMDQGDGNKIDMVTGATHRTDTHPGRAHHSWMLKVATDPSVEASLPAPTDAPAKKGNPAVAIAFFVALAAVLWFLFR
ncbi:MAG: hypothetical protein R3F60_20350 [bacterium]